MSETREQTISRLAGDVGNCNLTVWGALQCAYDAGCAAQSQKAPTMSKREQHARAALVLLDRLGFNFDGEAPSHREAMKVYLDALAVSPEPQAGKERLELAEAKLREQGIEWEEGKGYVFNGKD